MGGDCLGRLQSEGPGPGPGGTQGGANADSRYKAKKPPKPAEVLSWSFVLAKPLMRHWVGRLGQKRPF